MNTKDKIISCKEILNNCLSSENLEVSQKTLQNVIECCRKRETQDIEDATMEVSSQLLSLLSGVGLRLETQILCSTAFCATLSTFHIDDHRQNILMKCFLIDSSGNLEVNIEKEKVLKLIVKKLDVFQLCLCHGVLQCWSHVFDRIPQDSSLDDLCSKKPCHQAVSEGGEDSSLATLPQIMLGIIIDCCLKYSHLTHLAFRVMASWLEKVDHVESSKAEVYEKIFFVVTVNWESPMNGVREQNLRILNLLIETHPDKLQALLLEVLQHQPWTVKSKFLLLTVLLPKYGVARGISEFKDVPQGLMMSLYHSHLVSAGSDLYKVCLHNLNDQEWISFFLQPVLNILSSQQDNARVGACNLFSYWMTTTLKRFPSLADTILYELSIDNMEAILHILKFSPPHHSNLYNKVTFQTGEEVIILDLIRKAIKQSDELIRQLAFAVVCLSSKVTATPTTDELQSATDFLIENVNMDSAPFRQSVFSSCSALLRRLHTAGVHELQKLNSQRRKHNLSEVQHERQGGNKIGEDNFEWVGKLCKECLAINVANNTTNLASCLEGITMEQSSMISTNSPVSTELRNCPGHNNLKQIACFLDWLHKFLLKNLEPGTNYQRKILSLRLYHLLLKTCSGDMNKKSNKVGASDFLDYTACQNKCDFKSRRSCFVLLSCILDPTEDVRETAGVILIEYFCHNYIGGKDIFHGKEISSQVPGGRDVMDCIDALHVKDIAALLEKGINLCGSSKFYETESGALLLTFVATWLYRSQQVSNLGSYYLTLCQNKTLMSLLFKQGRKQWNTMKAELLAATTSGSPVHGIITALTRVVIEKDGPEYSVISWEDKVAVLTLLEDIVQHLLGVLASKTEGNTDYAPSFAEMGEAIDSAAQQDSVDIHLSAAHQLLLNCVWLNLKACCQLASALGSSNPDIDVVTLRRCIQLVTHVLTRCRHKGAIESAGVALGRLVQAASTTSHQNLPAEILEEFFTSQTGGASVTRRSAGLAIFVHKIVGSDMQVGKPLIVMAVSHLISVASKPVGENVVEISDLPQAQALHFLHTLVHDASLKQHMAPFISQVAMLCFENFTSPVWTIRNGALQLYGAIVSKLIGQKKAQEDDVVGTLEELSAHFPTLLNFITSKLEEAIFCPGLHPTLVPFLSLLSKMSINHPYLTSSHSVSVKILCLSTTSGPKCPDTSDVVVKLLYCLVHLLSSHIHTVRKLTAKAVANLISFPSIETSIVELMDTLASFEISNYDEAQSIHICYSENQLHGLLLTLQYLTLRFLKESTSMSNYSTSFVNICTALKKLSDLKFKSYYNFALVLELVHFTESDCDIYTSSYCELMLSRIDEEAVDSKGFVKIAFYYWISTEIDLIMRHCCDRELFSYFMRVLMHPRKFTCDILQVVKVRLSKDTFPTDIKLNILHSSFSLFLSENVSFTMLPLLEIILLLCSQGCSLSVSSKDLDTFYDCFVRQCNYGQKHVRTCMAISANILASIIETHTFSPPDDVLTFFLELSGFINSQSNPDNSDEYQRYFAALSLNFLAKSVLGMLKQNQLLPFKIQRDIFQSLFSSCIILLQDEIINVRREVARFASFMVEAIKEGNCCEVVRNNCGSDQIFVKSYESKTLNPYHCVQVLLSKDYIKFWLGEEALIYLWNQLDFFHDLEEITSRKETTITSPFDHGTCNVYEERVKIVELCYGTTKDILKSMDKETCSRFLKMIKVNESLFEKTWATVSEVSTTKGIELHQAHLVAKKLNSQLEIVAQLDDEFARPTWSDDLLHRLHNYGLLL